MMTLCHSQGCPEWAQWKVSKPHWDDERKHIIAWEQIAVLCGVHKQEQEAMPENEELRFSFAGAIPAWR